LSLIMEIALHTEIVDYTSKYGIIVISPRGVYIGFTPPSRPIIFGCKLNLGPCTLGLGPNRRRSIILNDTLDSHLG